jgi:acetyltransferase-like isoleucine patch superfamily enzyme
VVDEAGVEKMKVLATILTLWCPFGKPRKRMRDRLTNWLYSRRVVGKAKKVGVGLSCGGTTVVTKKTEIGDHVSLNGVRVHGIGAAKIGSYVHIGMDTLILTQNHNYDGDQLPYDWTFVAKDVEIGQCAWIGARVTLLPGTKIGEGAIIQAGSVVHGEIPACAIAGGNPAKVFASRNIEKYEQLKREGKFRKRYL